MKQFIRFLVIIWVTAVGLFSLVTLIRATDLHTSSGGSTMRYVRSDGNNSGNDCTNAASPCATLQHAIDQAAAQDQIRVAGGTYTDLVSRQGFTQTAYISKSVSIIGGYDAAFTEPPNPQLNNTILDAQHNGRVLYITENNQVNLFGLTLANGSSTGPGGGLYSQDAIIHLSHSAVLSGQAEFGGGVYALRGSLTLEYTTISGNGARLGGGGVRLYQSQATFTANTIANNTAVLHGGGLYFSFTNSQLDGNQINNNHVTTANQGWGGGLHLHNSSATLAYNTIANNSADTGGGLRVFESATTLTGNLIRNNQANVGGGLSLESSSQADLVNNVVADNTAVLSASGVRVLNADLNGQHTTIARNNGAEGSGLLIESGTASLINTIMADQTIGVLNNSVTTGTLTATLWDNVAQPMSGPVQESLSQVGNAAFAADGYHLTAVSDAIDNGVDAGILTDIDDLPRPVGSGFDLGAVEWRSLTAVKTASTTFAEPGDIVTYTISLGQPLTPNMSVMLTDVLPADMTFVGPLIASSGSSGFASGVITWTGTVPTDTAVIIQWPVQLNPGLLPGTTITNTASLQDAHGVYASSTAVIHIPAKVYLPVVSRSAANE